jgi:NDP-4-keto-2,6-dideoxyhexose 3-C-methyltransferase
MNYTERKTCRACGAALPLQNMLDLGKQTIVDFLSDGEPGRGTAPLELVQCSHKGCELLQLRHTVDADTLYRTFWYRSGINEQMRKALYEVVKDSLRYTELRSGDAVCDIGSNDGTLLGFYPDEVKKIGFEPAEKLAEESCMSATRHLHVVCDYFKGSTAERIIRGKKYKVVTAVAMFYDLDEPLEFLDDVASVLHPEGIFVVQMNYLGLMARNMAFDNIGHEHLCYYALSSLLPLFEHAGLKIVDVETNDVNGGSFRVYARRKNGHQIAVEDGVNVMLQEEREHLSRQVKEFSQGVRSISLELCNFVTKLHRAGKKVYAYGASTRGSTLLQTVFGGDSSYCLEGVAERDVHKIGKTTAGTGLKIVSEEEARENADYFLLLPYHFFSSIMRREQNWMESGGKFIVPVPYPRVYSAREGMKPQAVDLEKELVGR